MRYCILLLMSGVLFAEEGQKTMDSPPEFNPVEKTVEVGGKTAGLIADYGMLVMVGVLFLAVGATALWLVARYYNRKISGDYILKTEALAEIQKSKPGVLQLPAEKLPDLRNHRLFPLATKLMRSAEAGGSTGKVGDLLARDLSVWTLRGYRDAFQDLLDAAYDHKDGFDAYLGDAVALRARAEALYTEIAAAVRYRLVDEFGFPAKIYDTWAISREESDRLMVDMLEISFEYPTPYWRLRAVLDSVYARCAMTRLSVGLFLRYALTDDVQYNPEAGITESTVPAMGRRTPTSYPAAMFEKARRQPRG